MAKTLDVLRARVNALSTNSALPGLQGKKRGHLCLLGIMILSIYFESQNYMSM